MSMLNKKRQPSQ